MPESVEKDIKSIAKSGGTPLVVASKKNLLGTVHLKDIVNLEAYLANGDPAVPLKDKDGNIPNGLTTPSVGTPGPGHNAWVMTSSALVLVLGSYLSRR